MTELQLLLSKQWVKRSGDIDQSMVDYCLKSSKYIDTGSYYLDIGDSKPTIDSQMWYDDETDGPDASKFEAFRAYNLRSNNPRRSLEKLADSGNSVVYVYNKYTRDATDGKIKGWLAARIGEEPRHVGNYSLATDDDIMAIKQGLSEIAADYEKRLKTYWKRYSNKVHASGYWANR